MKSVVDRLKWLVAPAAEGDELVAAAPKMSLVAVFQRFWPFARPYRKWVFALLALIIIAPAIDLVGIWLFKILVDEVLVPADFGPFWWLAAGFFGLTLASGVVAFLDDYVSTLVAERFLLDLRVAFFRRLHALGLEFFERRQLGDVLQRTTTDVDAIETLMLSGIADILTYFLSIVMFGFALFYLQWDLALASLIIIPALFSVASTLSKRIKQASREKRRRSGSAGAVAEESLSNVMLVQAYNRQDWEVDRFRAENLGKYHAELAATRFKGLFAPILGVIEFLGGIMVIGLGTWEISQGRLSLGGMFAFFAYLARLYSPVQGLSNLQGVFFSAVASAERVIEFLDEEPAVTDRPDARAIDRAQGSVRFEDVTFTYPETDKPALQHVSFALEPGETLALVGPSGAGKSTIAKLLLRFYDLDSGRIVLDGHDIAELKLQSLRDNVAVLLQETLVFDGTVADNIAYGRPGAGRDEIVAAAKAADAHEFISALPDGYDTVVGQKGRLLSGGQRQRLAIARAMIRDAPVLILDEPTTGLDAESGERILEPLRRLMAGRATIVISHNLQTIRDATRVLVIEDGRITEQGTHGELIGAGRTYTRLHASHTNGNGNGNGLPSGDGSPAQAGGRIARWARTRRS
jgi:ABC-type multidrug transport system fused ATPase/permease subunit